VLVDAFDFKYGLGMMCGKMESGKTVSLAALMNNDLSRPGNCRKKLHMGSPIEYLFDRHPGADLIFQKEIPAAVANYPLALKAAKSETPDTLIMEEVNDLETMSMIIDAATSGIGVWGTLHISRIAAMPGTMMTYYPDADQREGRLYAAFEAMQVIVVQRLEPAIKDGDDSKPDGRCCLREYLVFDEAMRNKVLERPTREWSRVLNSLVADHGCSMLDSARELHAEGRLSHSVLSRIESGRAT
jgi:defect-in-organelle-trafficking protein DotB